MKPFMLILWTVAAAVAGIGWAAAVQDDQEAAYKKLEKFAGTWQLVAYEKDGVKSPEADPKQIKHIFTGDKFTLELAGKTVQEGWICIDPTRKPKVIDFYATKPEGKVEMGIYEWDGDDKLKVNVLLREEIDRSSMFELPTRREPPVRAPVDVVLV